VYSTGCGMVIDDRYDFHVVFGSKCSNRGVGIMEVYWGRSDMGISMFQCLRKQAFLHSCQRMSCAEKPVNSSNTSV
jgi:hypothetical protein